jgi:hypothetical protein
MDKLRILSLACRASTMKRLITLIILLLAGPSLASAQELFRATSGGLAVSAGDTSTSFSVRGPGFSMGGFVAWSSNANPFQLGIQAEGQQDRPRRCGGADRSGAL